MVVMSDLFDMFILISRGDLLLLFDVVVFDTHHYICMVVKALVILKPYSVTFGPIYVSQRH